LAQTVQNHPDLAQMIADWPALPDYIKQTIHTLINHFMKDNTNG
jgi:hypothetical protein